MVIISYIAVVATIMSPGMRMFLTHARYLVVIDSICGRSNSRSKNTALARMQFFTFVFALPSLHNFFAMYMRSVDSGIAAVMHWVVAFMICSAVAKERESFSR